KVYTFSPAVAFSSVAAGGGGAGGCTNSGTDQVERSSGGGGTTGSFAACSQPMTRRRKQGARSREHEAGSLRASCVPLLFFALPASRFPLLFTIRAPSGLGREIEGRHTEP